MLRSGDEFSAYPSLEEEVAGGLVPAPWLRKWPSRDLLPSRHREHPSQGGAGLIDLVEPRYQELLLDMCDGRRPSLVVIDSLAAAASRGETSIKGSRAILGFLTSVARDHGLRSPALAGAMLVSHHLRKQASSASPRAFSRRAALFLTTRASPARTGAGQADDRRGSSHHSAAARSLLAMSL